MVDHFPRARAGVAYGDVVSRLGADEEGPYVFRRVPRTSVKGYSRLEPWAVRRIHGHRGGDH